VGDGAVRQAILLQASADVTVFHMANCEGCELEMPFDVRAERDVWAGLHIAGTEHKVSIQTMVRIDTRESG
jgi:hypothetical protein